MLYSLVSHRLVSKLQSPLKPNCPASRLPRRAVTHANENPDLNAQSRGAQIHSSYGDDDVCTGCLGVLLAVVDSDDHLRCHITHDGISATGPTWCTCVLLHTRVVPEKWLLLARTLGNQSQRMELTHAFTALLAASMRRVYVET